MGNNRVRAFAEVARLDAWHSKPDNSGRSKLHVELSFSEGRIGGDDHDLQITFRLRIKRAVLSIRLSDPLEPIRSSISRSVPETELIHTRVKRATAEIRNSGKAEVSITPSRMAAALAGVSENSSTSGYETELKLVQSLPLMLVSTNAGPEGAYSWQIEPTFLNHLDGQPWHPIEKPRMIVRNMADDNIGHVVEATLSCLKEDLIVDDVKLKSSHKELLANVTWASDLKERVAEQHIKKVLTQEGLEIGEMNDRFSRLVLASAVAFEEND